MTRRLNWRAHLEAWATSQLGRPFAWGTCDCACLARGALEAMLGRPVARDVPPYTDVAGARAAWQAVGGLRGALTTLGAREVPGRLARPGDILVAPTDGFESALVFVDRHLIGVEPDKIVARYPYAALRDTATAYRIG